MIIKLAEDFCTVIIPDSNYLTAPLTHQTSHHTDLFSGGFSAKMLNCGNEIKVHAMSYKFSCCIVTGFFTVKSN